MYLLGYLLGFESGGLRRFVGERQKKRDAKARSRADGSGCGAVDVVGTVGHISGCVRERHLDVVLPGNGLYDGQAQARSLNPRAEHAVEGIEHARAFCFGNPRARVGDAKEGVMPVMRVRVFPKCEVDRDPTAFGRVANGILLQIPQHPVKRVRGHRGGGEAPVMFEFFEARHFEVDRLLLHLVPEGFDDEAHGFVKGRAKRPGGSGIGRRG